MHFSRSATSRTRLVILALMIVALALSLGHDAAVNAHPVSSLHHATTGGCIGSSNNCWSIVQVDFGEATTNTYITGIEDGGNIVGAMSSNNGKYKSFWAAPSPTPPMYATSAPTPENDPNENSTYLQGLTNNGSQGGEYQVGYANAGSDYSPYQAIGVVAQGNGTGGTTWTTVQDPNAGTTANCGGTEVLAMNDTEQGVGFYWKGHGSSCKRQAFEFYPNSSGSYVFFDFSPSPPPGSSSSTALGSTANGINTLGDVVGTVYYGNASNPKSAVWFYSELKYYSFAHPGSISTEGRGIDYEDEVVGDYVDPTSGATHGFFVNNGESAPPAFVTIDFSQASTPYTAINSINTNHDIAGWFLGKGAGALYHGFVGVCAAQSSNC